ncbi:MAG: outer membrane beta-barrel protein [Bacteroidetes bacterium]|nr:outer membrane beta-barrel protein [Bacteroidota bacterium]
MKKAILLSVCLVYMAAAYSQNSFYLSLGVGAGINTARTYDLYQDGIKVHPVGLGKGFAPVLRAGIFLNDFMAIELGVAYRMGINTKVDISNPAIGSPTGSDKFSGGMLQLVPAVVIQPDFDLGSVSPYARVGVIIGIIPNIKCKFDATTGNHNEVGTIKYTGGVSIGGSAALGCDFDLSDMLALYVEIYYDAMAYAPTKGKMTKYSVDGQDQLSTLNTSQKETKFVKDLTGFVHDHDSPDQQLKNSYPFNNVGLNVGVKIKL